MFSALVRLVSSGAAIARSTASPEYSPPPDLNKLRVGSYSKKSELEAPLYRFVFSQLPSIKNQIIGNISPTSGLFSVIVSILGVGSPMNVHAGATTIRMLANR